MEKPEFPQIYQQFKEKVWRLVSKFVSGHHDRQDLFQEVFLKIHNALPAFRKEAALATWIYRITANTAINHLKAQKRRELLHQLLSGLRLVHEESLKELEDPIVLPLKLLNPRQKMILLMADVEEIKLEDIAAALKLPIGTVKSNLSRAREIIRKELGKNG